MWKNDCCKEEYKYRQKKPPCLYVVTVKGCHLSRQQRVGVEALHAADQLILGVHHVVHKRPANQEPVGASVHGDALWDLAVPEAPHVCVTLKEEAVQTLLTDEAEGGGAHDICPSDSDPEKTQEEERSSGLLPCVVPAMRLDEVHVSVLGQEGHQLVVGPGGRNLSAQRSPSL